MGLAYISYPGWMLVSGVVDGHEGRARWALRRQAEPDRFKVEGKSLLMVAAAHGDDRMVELLLDYGADPNRSTFLTDSAVVGAVEAGHLTTVELLLRRGAELDGAGTSALSLAAALQNYPMVRVLLRGGADPRARALHCKTALEIATELDDRVMLEMFSQVSGTDH